VVVGARGPPQQHPEPSGGHPPGGHSAGRIKLGVK
jgi:hypothetical protein